MEFDFAIIYFGLTRSTKKVYPSHLENVFKELEKYGQSYKVFMHTWKTADNSQRIWEDTISKPIDYEEYKLLNPDFYTIDKQDEFTESINMDDYFYKHTWNTIGHSVNGEWLPGLILNHLCALQSQKLGLEMVESYVHKGNKFKYVMYIRPDVFIRTVLPINDILRSSSDIFIPNEEHHEGINDRFAIIKYDKACQYGKRINEIAEFRKNNGRIVSEKYVKFILEKYQYECSFINFSFFIVRP